MAWKFSYNKKIPYLCHKYFFIDNMSIIILSVLLLLFPLSLEAQTTNEDWSWISTESHHHVIKHYPEELDYEEYSSHPNLRVMYDYVFDNKGNLVYTITEPYYSTIYGTYITHDEEDKCKLVMTVLLNDFNNNKYDIKSTSKENQAKVKQTIISLGKGTDNSNLYNNSISSRYVEQIFEDELPLLGEPLLKERTGNNTFTYSFGDDSIHYQLYYTYVNEEPYRAKYNVKVKILNPPVKFEETNNEVVDNLDNEQIQENTEEIPPSFNGDLNEWVNKNLNYPKEAIENGIMGKVIVRFMVDKDGNVTQVQIVRSPDPILSREALRLFKTMPKWTPGTQGGKPVGVWLTYPITFRYS